MYGMKIEIISPQYEVFRNDVSFSDMSCDDIESPANLRSHHSRSSYKPPSSHVLWFSGTKLTSFIHGLKSATESHDRKYCTDLAEVNT